MTMKILKKFLGVVFVLAILGIGGLFLSDYMNSVEHIKIVLIVMIAWLISIWSSKDDLERELDILKDRVDQLEYETSELQSRSYE